MKVKSYVVLRCWSLYCFKKKNVLMFFVLYVFPPVVAFYVYFTFQCKILMLSEGETGCSFSCGAVRGNIPVPLGLWFPLME